IRRADESKARAVVVVDHDDKPIAILNETAVMATPEQRRPWLEAGTLGRTLSAGPPPRSTCWWSRLVRSTACWPPVTSTAPSPASDPRSRYCDRHDQTAARTVDGRGAGAADRPQGPQPPHHPAGRRVLPHPPRHA